MHLNAPKIDFEFWFGGGGSGADMKTVGIMSQNMGSFCNYNYKMPATFNPKGVITLSKHKWAFRKFKMVKDSKFNILNSKWLTWYCHAKLT